jgi:crotonobetainyl-CoA:carnitine CoA-transferase CaiB-like acyl-CoA transferase
MGALERIRVLDFGQYLAGPLVAMMLADQGADVIRIDPPGGPLWSHPANAILQRGKRSVVLDLKSPADATEALRLAQDADILIENFRPGVMARLGLGAGALLARHSRLIYCSLPGFASDDPRANVRAFEGVIGAAAGLYRMPQWLPPSHEHPADVPIFSALPLASTFAAFVAAHSIVAALIARRRTGRGQSIEVPLFDSVFWISADRLCVRDGKPRFSLDVPDDLRRLMPILLNHQCKDGRWIFVSPPIRGIVAFAHRFLQPLPPRNAGPEEMASFKDRVDSLFRSKTAAEWEKLGSEETGTGIAVCQTTEEWLNDPHARESRCVIGLDDPEFGPTWQAGYPVALSRTPPKVWGSRRTLGTDNGARFVAQESEEAPVATELKQALAGFRVIDITQVLAGPVAGRILADYGADVIKINDPRPDANPTGVMVHEFVNAGKRTMLLNLASKEGVGVLRQLISGADVFHQNFVRGAAARMGFGEDEVRKIRPDIIYSSLNTHAEGGFRTFYRGHEELGQAVTGIQERYGDHPKPETHAGWTLCDYGNGHLSAFAILLALFHRLRTGEGQHVSASLSGTGTYYQIPFMLTYAGHKRDEPRGLYTKGWNAQDRFYKASDRWFYVAAPGPDGRDRLMRVAGVAPGSADLASALAERFATAPAAHWVERLNAMGIGAHVATDYRHVLTDETAERRGLVLRRNEKGKEARSLGIVSRLSLTQPIPGSPAPLGAHTRDLLAEIGLADRFADLVAKGVVAEAAS